MKFILVTIITAVCVSSLAKADSPCKTSCPNGYKNVAVRIESIENLKTKTYTDRWSAEAAKISFTPPDGMPFSGIHFVEYSSKLREILLGYDQKCERIKYLAMDGHGGLGSLVLGTSLSVNNMESVLGGLDCVMAENAYVEMGGCNVGRGCRGEDFLSMMATILLKGKGGKVRAFTNYVWTLFGGEYFGINGDDTQILEVNKELTRYEWDDAPDSAQTCADRADDAAQGMAHLIAMTKRCVSAKRLENMQYVKNKLDLAAEMQALIAEGGQRTQLGWRGDWNAAQTFYTAFEMYEFYMEHSVDLYFKCKDSSIADVYPSQFPTFPKIQQVK